MDRIHRLGQHRPVEAIKLVIEDSIESRIVQLQEKKSAMINATLSTDDSAMGRLTPEDVSALSSCLLLVLFVLMGSRPPLGFGFLFAVGFLVQSE